MKHIIFASDNNYAMPCMVAMASLLYNTDSKDCDIHILTEGFNEKNTAALNRLRQHFNEASISLDIVGNNFLLKDAIISSRFPIANFFRLLIPQIYDFEKALYLDCDIIVNKDISPLWNIDITNHACGMVIDQDCDDITLHNRIDSYDLPYYNAGVMLMNLELWRKENITDKVMTFMKNFPQCCLYPDQDAINKVVGDKILELPCQYNVQENWFKPSDRWGVHKNKWTKIEDALKSPTIIHYTGHDKPWSKVCPHPFKAFYKDYGQFLYSSDKNNIAIRPAAELVYDSNEYLRIFEEIERKKRHRHIRRANLFTILFSIETLLILGYFLLSLLSQAW